MTLTHYPAAKRKTSSTVLSPDAARCMPSAVKGIMPCVIASVRNFSAVAL
jgi:hypothetical protein